MENAAERQTQVDEIRANLAAVRERMAAAAARADRNPAEITLVAVSKTQPPNVVRAAATAGLQDFGENRVEEALPKMAAAQAGLRWHMIGHIQRRKSRAVAGAGFSLIHSVDSLALAERLGRLAAGAGVRLDILLECNLSGETSKTGFAARDPARWDDLLHSWLSLIALPGLRVRGLMTLAPVVPAPDQARPYFARLRRLRDRARQFLPGASWDILSMGMTDDFEAAIAEGATTVRIGRALFGERRT